MENKTTSELLNLLANLDDKKGDWQSGGKYDQIMDVLRSREPFADILDEDRDRSIPALWNAIKELQEEVKQLKRHKHDPKSGDVMIRI
jgi:hypothetical protein